MTSSRPSGHAGDRRVHARGASVPVLALGLLLSACGGEPPVVEPRVIVLGIDGLDPDVVRERVAAGTLPNFAHLALGGPVHDLGTSWPPQSPVAWTTFATGTNPGRHGLFDFIHLDRSTYGLATSMSRTGEPWLDWQLFGGCVPLVLGATQERTRAAPAFWDELADAGIPVAIHRIPADFPVESDSDAVVFPDMGTPDLTGAASGRASLWFERSAEADELGWGTKRGASYAMQAVELNRLRLDADGRGVATASSILTGPPDGEGEATAAVSFFVDTGRDEPVLAAEVGDELALASLGDWSGWVPVEFELSCGLSTVSGWTRFLFLSAEPFAVYAAPIQIDPWDPVMAVSSPPEAAAELADAIGPYYTQGFPDAYKAYKTGLLDTTGFLSESDTVLGERLRMLDYALDEFDGTGGLLFFYVGALDLRSHMLWFHGDEAHPHREAPGRYEDLPEEYLREADELGLDPHAGLEYARQVERIYTQVDDLLGHLLEAVEARWPDAELVIVSDHGFAPMHRVMNVNDWLVEEGYLVLREPGTTGDIAAHGLGDDGHVDFDSSIVDWERSEAFSVGFNGVLLNRKGREPRGIVDDARAKELLAEIRTKLLALRDEDGTPVFTRVLPATEVFDGPATGSAPDLQLGFNVGYGASDPSAEGRITGEPILVDNDSRWSGSHLMDPDLVPGTLMVRDRSELAVSDPGLEDVTATLYELFGVDPPPTVEGRALFRGPA